LQEKIAAESLGDRYLAQAPAGPIRTVRVGDDG
jgi:hypothetical protein